MDTFVVVWLLVPLVVGLGLGWTLGLAAERLGLSTFVTSIVVVGLITACARLLLGGLGWLLLLFYPIGLGWTVGALAQGRRRQRAIQPPSKSSASDRSERG